MKAAPWIAFWTKRLTTVVLGAMALWLSTGSGWAAETSSDAAKPVDLTSKYPVPLSALTNSGWLAMKTIPVGHQVFHHVPFDIGGELHLWGYGRSTNNTSPYPERITDIEANRQFETLYVYHGSYYKTPEGTPVCKVVLRYEDGTSATNTLKFGADILDWMVGSHEEPLNTPYATNSMLAWVGGQFSENQKNRLRFCMTALDNPHPDRTVGTIDLISCKTMTVPIILAMTTGPAGLMKGNTSGRK